MARKIFTEEDFELLHRYGYSRTPGAAWKKAVRAALDSRAISESVLTRSYQEYAFGICMGSALDTFLLVNSCQDEEDSQPPQFEPGDDEET